jgi:hypothetical protein
MGGSRFPMDAGSSAALLVRAVSGLVVLVASVHIVHGQTPAEPAVSGRALYTTYCRSCHGPEGRGDGIIRDYLRRPPTNLRVIAQRSNGVFPAEWVRRVIDGREPVKTHGESQMPVWGDAFSASDAGGGPRDPRERINALVAYVESIQDKVP